MIPCSQCKKDLDQQGKDALTASISGSIMGDEYTESYYFCKDCLVYTVQICHDRFSGDEDISFRGPLDKQDGDDQVKLIGQCSIPWNKKCRCAAHCSYFGEWLDWCLIWLFSASRMFFNAQVNFATCGLAIANGNYF